MKNKLYFCRLARRRVTEMKSNAGIILLVGLMASAPAALAGDAPQWMHAVVNAPLPAHDEKDDAVLLYSERNVNVQSADKIRTVVREVYKILRPGGREHGNVFVHFTPLARVTSLHGWCIPAQGKDYEVKDKDAVEVSFPKVDGSELISDLRVKLLTIPAPDPGNIVGYEYELEEQPLLLQDLWFFQDESPARESHYSLQLPPGWEYKASWLNYPQVKPTQAGNNLWQWSVSDIKRVREQDDMPPMSGLVGQMIVSFFQPNGNAAKTFANWKDMGIWYRNLTTGREDASPQIKQKVAELTASTPTLLGKMRALANFVQHDIRYVAIELGIGGHQPHPAAEVFSHHYGDCKDKATLMGSMLHEIGVESYYVIINTERGSVGPETPAHTAFNHAIIAIRLPDDLKDPALVSTIQHSKLGRILFFDPTNELTPFGQIRGHLQSNYGLLVTPNGGELVELPRQPSVMNSIHRTAKLTLD